MKRRLFFAYLLIILPIFFCSTVHAATGTIDATNHYAWSDNGGYVNWAATGGNVTVTNTALTGYIWSASFGWINLAPDQGGITNNTGTLSGFAWGANTGWISFSGVTIDGNGVFHGATVAQSLFGTMTFDCTHCNVTTTWRAGAASGGGGGTISGSQSYGYQTQSQTAGASSTSAMPRTLIPTTPPPNTEPASGPTSGATTPAHLTPSITLSISTAAAAVVGTPLSLGISFSNTKRTQNISYAYRLYRSGSIAYSNTGTLSPISPSSFTLTIPTVGLSTGAYQVAVSAQYGKQAIASQTLPVSLYATKAETSAYVSKTGSVARSEFPSCSWLTCWWRGLADFLGHLF